MNNVQMIGEVLENPKEVFVTKNNSTLYKLTLKVDDQLLNIKVWQSLLEKVSDIKEGSRLSILGKILSYGNNDSGSISNEIYANSIFVI